MLIGASSHEQEENIIDGSIKNLIKYLDEKYSALDQIFKVDLENQLMTIS
jgi:hypothetical protein